MIPSLYRLNLSTFTSSSSPCRFPWGLLISSPSTRPAWGIKISNYVQKNSVKRNTLKRQILNHLYQSRHILGNFHTVVIIKKYPQSMELKQLLSTLDRLLAPHH